jgi:hypothetical protein
MGFWRYEIAQTMATAAAAAAAAAVVLKAHSARLAERCTRSKVFQTDK